MSCDLKVSVEPLSVYQRLDWPLKRGFVLQMNVIPFPRMRKISTTVVAVSLVLSACGGKSAPVTHREQGAAAGALIGGVGGAAVGAQHGQSLTGANVGVAVGAVAGAMVGDSVESRDDTLKQQEEILRLQDEEIDRQRRELDDVKRQQFHNESLKRFERQSD